MYILHRRTYVGQGKSDAGPPSVQSAACTPWAQVNTLPARVVINWPRVNVPPMNTRARGSRRPCLRFWFQICSVFMNSLLFTTPFHSAALRLSASPKLSSLQTHSRRTEKRRRAFLPCAPPPGRSLLCLTVPRPLRFALTMNTAACGWKASGSFLN